MKMLANATARMTDAGSFPGPEYVAQFDAIRKARSQTARAASAQSQRMLRSVLTEAER